MVRDDEIEVVVPRVAADREEHDLEIVACQLAGENVAQERR